MITKISSLYFPMDTCEPMDDYPMSSTSESIRNYTNNASEKLSLYLETQIQGRYVFAIYLIVNFSGSIENLKLLENMNFTVLEKYRCCGISNHLTKFSDLEQKCKWNNRLYKIAFIFVLVMRFQPYLAQVDGICEASMELEQIIQGLDNYLTLLGVGFYYVLYKTINKT